MLIEINNDVYYILSRLKEIDKGYKIFYNTKKNKYEIHNENQIGNSYALTVPYNILDSRTVTLVRKTRIENQALVFEEIEKQNKKLELNSINKQIEISKCLIKENFKF